MTICKRLSALLLCLLMLCMLLPAQTNAAGTIDLTQEVGLTISYQEDDIPLVGVRFQLYLVATVDPYGELTTTPDFSQFNVHITGRDDDAWRKLASTLEGYVLRDKIQPTDSAQTDDQGLASFPSGETQLVPGIYLVLGDRLEQDGCRYDASPFMVMLPSLDEQQNVWVYQVTVNCKHSSEPIPEEPVTRTVIKIWDDDGQEAQRPKEVTVQLLRDGEVFDTVILNAENSWRYTWTELDDHYTWTVVEKELEDYTVEVIQDGTTFVVTNTYAPDTPDEPTPSQPEEPSTPSKPSLPNTGQLWWPIPALVAVGMLFVVIGLFRRRSTDHEE